MDLEKLEKVRDELIELRNACLGMDFDADGAVILSHAIRWASLKIDGKPYTPTTD